MYRCDPEYVEINNAKESQEKKIKEKRQIECWFVLNPWYYYCSIHHCFGFSILLNFCFFYFQETETRRSKRREIERNEIDHDIIIFFFFLPFLLC